MYCPKCGTQNPDDAQSCSTCGAVLTPSQTTTQPITPKTSGLAIASLVCAILSVFTCMVSAIPAIILGIIGLVKIGNSKGRLKGTGMAIAGIVTPAVAIPIIALLMGILMPALARTRQLAFRMVCGTNMSGLSKAMMIYADDYDDKYPTPDKWCDLLIEYCEVDPISFHCKGAEEGPCNYALNENVVELGISTQPDIVLLFETYPGWNQVGGPEILTTDNHQGDGCNVSFVDGHVEFVKAEDIGKLKWKPD
jgi:prepilin-type processing-associated H-X9-DG protein